MEARRAYKTGKLLVFLAAALWILTQIAAYVVLRQEWLLARVRTVLTRDLAAAYGLELSFENLAAGPGLGMQLSNLDVRDLRRQGKPLVARVDRVYARLSVFRLLFHPAHPEAAVAEVLLDRPRLTIAHGDDGDWLWERFTEKPAGRVYLRPTIRWHGAELHLAASPLPHPIGRHLAAADGALDLGDYPRLRGWTRLRTDLDPSLRLWARVDYDPDRASGWVHLDWSGASPAKWQRSGWLPDDRLRCLEGVLRGNARIDLGQRGGLREATVTLSRGSLAIEGAALPVLSVTGRVELRRRTIWVSGLEVKAGASRLRGGGRVDLSRSEPVIQADLELANLSIPLAAQVLGLSERAAVKGTARGRIKIAGSMSHPEMSGDLLIDGGLSFPPFPALERVRLAGRFAGQSFAIESLRAEMGPARLDGRGELKLLPAPRLQIDLSARNVAVAEFLAGLGQPGWRGSADLDGRLDASPARWTLAAGMSWRGASYRDRPLPDGGGECSLLGSEESLELQGEWRVGDGLLKGKGRLRAGRWEGKARLTRIGLAPLAAFLPPAFQDTAGVVTADLIWRDGGESDAGEVIFAGGIEELVFAGRRIDMLQASLSWSDAEIAVQAAQIKTGSASATCQGRLDLIGKDLWLQAAVHGLPLALLSADLPGRAEGRFDLSGRWPDALTGEGWLHLNELAWHGVDLGVARVTLALQEDRLSIVEGEIEAPDGRSDLSGWVSLAGELACEISNLDWDVAPLGGLLPEGAELRGRLRGEADITGTVGALEASARVEIGPGQAYGLDWQGIEADLRWDEELVLERGTLRAFGTEFQIAGTVGPDWNLSVRTADADLAAAFAALPHDLPWPLGGRITLTGTIGGPLARPSLAGEAAITGFTMGDLKCSQVAAEFSLDGRLLRLSKLEAWANEQRYSAAGEFDLRDRRLDLNLSAAKGDLSALLGLAAPGLSLPLQGLVSGQGRIEGPLDDPAIEAAVRVEEGAIGRISYEGEAEFIYAGGTMTCRELRMAYDGGGLEAAGRFSRTELRLELQATGLPLAELAALAGAGEMPVAGRGDLRLDLDRTGPSMRGDFRLDIGRGASLAGITLDGLTAAGTIEDRNIIISDASLAAGGHSLSILGRFPLPENLGFVEGVLRDVPAGQDRLELRIEGTGVPAALLNPALREMITFTGGQIDVAARLAGTWAKPVMDGSIVLREGKGRSSLLPDPFSNLTVQARLDGQTILLEQAEARLGSGRARAGGAITLAGSGPRYDLWLKGGGVAYENPAFFDGEAAAFELAVKGGPIPSIEGAIEVAETRITVRSTPSESPPPPIPLDIRIAAGKNVRFALPGVMDIPLAGEVQLRGTLAEPTLSGILSASRGWVLVYGQRFDLTMAVGNFTHDRGYLPYVELYGQKTLGDIRVFVKAYGEVSESGLTIDFWSEPPLSRQEILSLLPPISPGPAENGRLSGGLEFFVETVFGQITEDVRRIISADQLQLTLDDQSGAFSLQLGKYIRDDLYISYEILFDEFSTKIWSFDYQLNSHLVLGGIFSSTEEPKWTLSYEIRF